MNEPYARAVCRTPAADPDWWGVDVDPATRALAATLCMGCPALTVCDRDRLRMGTDAAGTYAAHYQPLIDVETDTEFLEIAAALGWEHDLTPDRLNMRDNDGGGWEQLTLWGPSVRAAVAGRRRRVRPGGGSPSGRRATLCAHAAGA